MIWTNKHPNDMSEGICLAIKQFVERDEHGKDPERISATELCDAPLRRILKLRHWDDLEVDYSDYLWALLGSSVHYVLHLANKGNVLSEKKIEIKDKHGIILTLTPDRVIPGTKTLEDYKVTSVWSFIRGLQKESWENQINVYALGLRYGLGLVIEKATINAILKDHTKIRWFTERLRGNTEYPEIPFKTVPIQLWSEADALKYVQKRMQKHLRYVALDINEVPPCNDKERWYNIDQYAVVKSGAKRATRCLDTKPEAEEYIRENNLNPKIYSIETRGAVNTRCKYYCEFTKFCPYHKKFVSEVT